MHGPKDRGVPTDKMLSLAGSWDHRPAVSSPLSSSPIRPSSPLSPIHNNTLARRQTQSSPIQLPKLKFAARPTRPNPVVRRRQDAQESRRRDFLQSVRRKSDDRAWQRRDIEGQFIKASWLSHLGRLSHDAPAFSEADLEDAMAFQQHTDSFPEQDRVMTDSNHDEEDMSYEEQQPAPPPQPPSPTLSDDEYDAIFAELILQEQSQKGQSQGPSDPMDTTDDNGHMHF